MKGSIATVVAFFALGIVTLGIIAGKTLVLQGGRLIPQAQTRGTFSGYYLPSADSFVSQEKPSENNGSLNYIQADDRKGKIKEGYIKFEINDIQGKVTKAIIRLVATDNDIKNSPVVYLTSNNWSETEINYSNKPSRGQKIAEAGKREVRRPITIDVTSAINGNGVYSFIIASENFNSVKYNSREVNLNKPTLTVTYIAMTPTPSPSPSPTATSTLTPSPTAVGPSPTSQFKPGDANGDGLVDGVDYSIWQANYGKATNDNYKSGDFNGDGKVDGADYYIWFSNYSATPTPSLPASTPT